MGETVEKTVQHLEQQMLKADERLDNLAAQVGDIIERDIFLSADQQHSAGRRERGAGVGAECEDNDDDGDGDGRASENNEGGETAVCDLLRSVTEVTSNYDQLRKEITEVQELQRQLSAHLQAQLRAMHGRFDVLKRKLRMRTANGSGGDLFPGQHHQQQRTFTGNASIKMKNSTGTTAAAGSNKNAHKRNASGGGGGGVGRHNGSRGKQKNSSLHTSGLLDVDQCDGEDDDGGFRRGGVVRMSHGFDGTTANTIIGNNVLGYDGNTTKRCPADNGYHDLPFGLDLGLGPSEVCGYGYGYAYDFAQNDGFTASADGSGLIMNGLCARATDNSMMMMMMTQQAQGIGSDAVHPAYNSGDAPSTTFGNVIGDCVGTCDNGNGIANGNANIVDRKSKKDYGDADDDYGFGAVGLAAIATGRPLVAAVTSMAPTTMTTATTLTSTSAITTSSSSFSPPPSSSSSSSSSSNRTKRLNDRTGDGDDDDFGFRLSGHGHAHAHLHTDHDCDDDRDVRVIVENAGAATAPTAATAAASTATPASIIIDGVVAVKDDNANRPVVVGEEDALETGAVSPPGNAAKDAVAAVERQEVVEGVILMDAKDIFAASVASVAVENAAAVVKSSVDVAAAVAAFERQSAKHANCNNNSINIHHGKMKSPHPGPPTAIAIAATAAAAASASATVAPSCDEKMFPDENLVPGPIENPVPNNQTAQLEGPTELAVQIATKTVASLVLEHQQQQQQQQQKMKTY